jgi:hypothetical protein
MAGAPFLRVLCARVGFHGRLPLGILILALQARRVPHSCAFFAQGWDSTVAFPLGILILSRPARRTHLYPCTTGRSHCRRRAVRRLRWPSHLFVMKIGGTEKREFLRRDVSCCLHLRKRPVCPRFTWLAWAAGMKEMDGLFLPRREKIPENQPTFRNHTSREAARAQIDTV